MLQKAWEFVKVALSSRTALLLAFWVAKLVTLPVLMVWLFILSVAGHERAWKAYVGEDQQWNAMTGGDEDETVSSRAARARLAGKRWGCVLCAMLDKLHENHCKLALEAEQAKHMAGIDN